MESGGHRDRLRETEGNRWKCKWDRGRPKQTAGDKIIVETDRDMGTAGDWRILWETGGDRERLREMLVYTRVYEGHGGRLGQIEGNQGRLENTGIWRGGREGKETDKEKRLKDIEGAWWKDRETNCGLTEKEGDKARFERTERQRETWKTWRRWRETGEAEVGQKDGKSGHVSLGETGGWVRQERLRDSGGGRVSLGETRRYWGRQGVTKGCHTEALHIKLVNRPKHFVNIDATQSSLS